jgi:transcriptional regulator with PAS, ATPase and Fis domain
MIKKGLFREDLFYRLNVIHLSIPPLRERKNDIPLLVNFFIDGFNKLHGKNVSGITEKAMKKLCNYNWPGNVRQLKNLIEKAMVLTEKNMLDEDDLTIEDDEGRISESTTAMDRKNFLRQMDREYLEKLIEKHNGNITAAAKEAGITRATLYRIIKK